MCNRIDPRSTHPKQPNHTMMLSKLNPAISSAPCIHTHTHTHMHTTRERERERERENAVL